MASKQTAGVVAMRYASALVDIAEKDKKTDSILQDMTALDAMVEESSDFKAFIQSPLISRDEKQNAVKAIAKKAKLQDATENFLCLLAQNRRLNMLPEMIIGVRKEVSKRNGEVTADIKSAFPLDADQQKALQDTLAKSVGKNIAVNVEVDKDLIGGMVVTVGSQMFDASVKRKLERLKIAMTSGANANQQADKAANE